MAPPSASPLPLWRSLALVAAGWLVPGLGHFLGGWQRRGILLFALIGGSFLAGTVLSDFEAVSRQLHPYAFWAEIWVGAGTLPLLRIDPAASKVLPENRSVGTYQDVPRHNDTGVLFCAIAGLLNLLAMCELAERLLGRPAPALATGGAA